MVSKACYELKGERRWVLTGTPIVNRLEDLYSLLWAFLRDSSSKITNELQTFPTRHTLG